MSVCSRLHGLETAGARITARVQSSNSPVLVRIAKWSHAVDQRDLQVEKCNIDMSFKLEKRIDCHPPSSVTLCDTQIWQEFKEYNRTTQPRRIMDFLGRALVEFCISTKCLMAAEYHDVYMHKQTTIAPFTDV